MKRRRRKRSWTRQPETSSKGERKKDGEKEITFEVKVKETDMGKVIGKEGRIAKAIRTIVKAGANRTKTKVSVEIIEK